MALSNKGLFPAHGHVHHGVVGLCSLSSHREQGRAEGSSTETFTPMVTESEERVDKTRVQAVRVLP